jgi:predicted MFS family arabinose efflux permease
VTLAVIVYAYLLSQFYRAFMAVIAADMARDLGLGAAELGSLPAAWLLTFAAAQFLVGIMLDRFGPRRTMAGLMSAAVVGAAWLAGARGYADALAAMALIGLGCAPILMAGFYVVAHTYPPERFAALSSVLIGIGSLGDPLSATPLALAASALGWRGALLGLSGITAASVILVALFLRDPPRVPGAEGAPGALLGFVEVMRLRPLWRMLPITFVSYAVVVAIRGLWISPYLDLVHGLDAPTRGLAALGMGLAMAAGALLFGRLERWIGGPKRAVLGGVAAAALGCLALAVVGRESAALALVLLMIVGACGMSYAMLMAHARMFLPASLLGRGVTFMNFLFMAGAGLAQWSSGQVVERGLAAGLSPGGAFGLLFGGFAAVLSCALAVYAAAPRAPTPRAPSR